MVEHYVSDFAWEISYQAVEGGGNAAKAGLKAGDKLNINEGMLYENAIAQMLTANGHKLYFYTQYNAEKHRNDIEIDFLISNNSKLKYKMFPIEVKSGKKYSIESLKRFKEKYKARIGECYVIHPRNLSFKDDIICVPPYMTICL